jgi:hypothetical protein
MHRWGRWVVVATVALAGATGEAAAAPKAGDAFPVFTVEDVTGQRQSTASFRGAPTLVVAITERGAGDAMRAWFVGAQKRAPAVRQKGLISVSVPFFVSDSYARDKAREKIPKQYWHDNLFDSHLGIAKILGLSESDVPWVFVLDAEGRVVAAAHSLAEPASANAVWKSLEEASSATNR